ncbi:MAG TPA: diguanylate cyclase [Candidatus Aquilonibacter sp.]|nr:diguanylate cyclase [Candidatus Aquilonibacter sp.]
MDVNAADPAKEYGLDPRLLAELCDRAPDAVCIVERRHGIRDFVFRYLNAAFERLYGCRRAEILGTSTDAFFRSRASAEDVERVIRAFAGDQPFRMRRGMHRPDETFFWLEANFQPIPWEDGVRWMFITRDVTREKLEHDRIVQLSTAVEQGYEPVSISTAADSKWIFSYVNDAFVRATGYLSNELMGKSWEMFLEKTAGTTHLDTIRAALYAGQQVRTELAYRSKDGRHGIFEVQIQPIRESSTKKYTSIVSVYRDITESRAREERLEFEAAHDPLTNLYNRRHLERVLETAVAMTRSEPAHAFMFVDLDGFKEVNDRQGHDIGDRVLIAAARALESAAFRTDALGRWGGDEFAILLYHCSLVNAHRAADQFLSTFAHSPDRHGTSASVGVVSIHAGESAAEVVRRADKLCYRAKAAGGNRALSEPRRGDRIG